MTISSLEETELEPTTSAKVAREFFSFLTNTEKLVEIFSPDRYEIVLNEYVTKQVENRKRKLKMNRIWIQMKIIKR